MDASGLLEHRTLTGDSHNTGLAKDQPEGQQPYRNDRGGEPGMLLFHV